VLIWYYKIHVVHLHNLHNKQDYIISSQYEARLCHYMILITIMMTMMLYTASDRIACSVMQLLTIPPVHIFVHCMV